MLKYQLKKSRFATHECDNLIQSSAVVGTYKRRQFQSEATGIIDTELEYATTCDRVAVFYLCKNYTNQPLMITCD